MAATSYTHVTKPFLLPEGFNPEQTDIIRCVEEPRMGYLNPRKDVVYTFIFRTQFSYLRVYHLTAREMENAFNLICTHHYLFFVSPKVDSPVSRIDKEEHVGPFIKTMIDAWHKKTVTVTGYTHVTKPFLLPEGFNPEGIDIVRCVDDPRMGYLNPKEDVIYTFMYEISDGFRAISRTPSAADSKLRSFEFENQSKISIKFVSPELTSFGSWHWEIPSDRAGFYLNDMIEAWQKHKDAAPRKTHGIHGTCEIILGEQVVTVGNEDIQGVMYSQRYGHNIIGYKTMGSTLSEEVYDRVKSHYPELHFMDGIIPQSRAMAIARETTRSHGPRGPQGIAGAPPASGVAGAPPASGVAGPSRLSGPRAITGRKVTVLMGGDLDGLIYEDFADRKHIIGYREIGRVVPDEIVGKIGRDYTEHNFDFNPKVIPTKEIEGLKVMPFNKENHYIVIEGPLKDVILDRTDPKEIKVVGYQHINAGLHFPARQFLYLHYPNFKIWCPVFSVKSEAVYTIMKYGDNFIISEGFMEGVVFRREGDRRIILGMAPDMSPLDRNLAFEIGFRKSHYDFVLPHDKVKKEYLPVEGEDASCTISEGPLTGLKLRKGKKCFYLARDDLRDLSLETIAMIQDRYPSIVFVN